MHSFIKKVFQSALESNKPEALLEYFFERNPTKQFQADNPAYIIAVGKAAEPMAAKLVELYSVDVGNVLCIAPYSNTTKRDYTVYSSHPIPDKMSEEAGCKLIQFVEDIPAKSTVFFAISGGTSALVCEPVQGIEVQGIGEINKQLISSGASIDEVNCIRKHLSHIKGGQLLPYFKPDITLIDLVISDVPDDDLSVIGSGLTIPDSTTFQDTHDILLKYELWEKIPDAVQNHITKGVEGSANETLKPGEDPIKKHYSYVIGSAQKFAQAVAKKAEERGFKPWIADAPFNQPVKEVAEMISEKIVELAQNSDEKQAFIFYGESTVKVMGDGKGGRNQELALRGALNIAGMKGVTWLSAGTDGIDGPTDAAGAIVNGNTIAKAKDKGLDPEGFLRNNDSYHFHQEMGTLLKTGPTGNNMMDVVIVLVEGTE